MPTTCLICWSRRPMTASVRAKGIRWCTRAAATAFSRRARAAATEVPAEVGLLVAWVLERREFSRQELTAAFLGRDAAEVERLLREPRRDAPDRADLTGVACPPHCGNFVALSPDSPLMRRPQAFNKHA